MFAVALALAACAAPSANVTSSALVAADAATSLAAGERITLEQRTQTRSGSDDPLVLLTLRRGDGRRMQFEEANHAPNHLMAQAAGGPLAQIMGLFGEETPKLYLAREGSQRDAPFFCAPAGAHAIGVYEAPDGNVQIVGLLREIQFETRPDGQTEALPYSPDQVCARLRFRRG